MLGLHREWLNTSQVAACLYTPDDFELPRDLILPGRRRPGGTKSGTKKPSAESREE